MKAPDKIYIPTAGDELHYHMTCPNNEFQESIEYTRTDAFIEKACEWLRSKGGFTIGFQGAEIKDFKNYMQNESR